MGKVINMFAADENLKRHAASAIRWLEEQVVQAARVAGSRAKTYEGALKYLNKNCPDATITF